MRRLTPVLRITLGLVGLTASLLIAAHLFGIVPDESKVILDKRKSVVEALAVQIALEMDRLSPDTAQRVLEAVVERNEDMRSAALRVSSGEIIASSGDHAKFWKGDGGDRSTPEHLRAPIFDKERRWGTVEVAFAPLPTSVSFMPTQNRLLGLVLFIVLTGGVGYFFVLRRSLRALDPSAVIPERVRAAMDALVEGVLILDEKEQIVLANTSFAERVGVPAAALIGRKASDMNWRSPDTGGPRTVMPWRTAMSTKEACRGTALLLRTASGEVCRLMVNVTPILGAGSSVNGALATFADVTLLEQRNDELQRTLMRLKESQDKIEQHNAELRFLATRDSLTGCLNRRALFAGFEDEIGKARHDALGLSCAMVDIDHFKSINDRYGHATGDKVIALVAETLRLGVREHDLVARYGGEELCVVFPGLDAERAHALIDGLRASLHSAVAAQFTASMRVTFSAGIASLRDEDADPAELIARADEALYAAKQRGRNRVLTWYDGLELDQPTDAGASMRALAPTARSSSATARLRAQHGSNLEVRQLVDRVRELEERLKQQQFAVTQQAAQADPATGLPNESLFRDRITQSIARAQRGKHVMAVLHVELELSARARDTLGPQVSEQLVVEMARRLSRVFRESDTIALIGPESRGALVSRLAGGDFGILLGELDRVESVTWIIQRIINSTSRPVKINGRELTARCAVGVSVYPGDGVDADSLLRHAGEARGLARQRPNKDRYAFYAREITDRAEVQLQTESDLRLAIERGELSLHYQPKISVSTKRLVGLEALLRWHHPKHGFISPADFIPVAEQSGMIIPIGEWAIQMAARQAKLWQKINIEPVRVAVNLSTLQLRSEHFVDRVQTLLESVELDSRLLEVEITESVFMDDLDSAARVLRKLRNLGVHVSLDDFGTGYSSLSYLRQLPIDSLKIDGSFISDIAAEQQGSALVSAIIGMAHELGIRVVAEGVETPEQMMVLRDMNCDEAQGYVISKPLPIAAVPDFIRACAGGQQGRQESAQSRNESLQRAG
jgi:diguanylate cyclase (GGDEF)-like protein/PAS domain S-box-containing protein